MGVYTKGLDASSGALNSPLFVPVSTETTLQRKPFGDTLSTI